MIQKSPGASNNNNADHFVPWEKIMPIKFFQITIISAAALMLSCGTQDLENSHVNDPLNSRSGEIADVKAADCPPCGPDLCLGDPRFPPKLAQKKKELKAAGYPDDLIKLIDRDGKCVMAIERAPDVFTILLETANGSSTVPWTQQDEDLAKKEILSGKIKAYYKYNARKVFACCNEPAAENRGDWNDDLQMSTGLAIACKKQGNAVVCK